MRFKRECSRCEEMFRPNGKVCKLCNKCWKLAIKNNKRNGIIRGAEYYG